MWSTPDGHRRLLPFTRDAVVRIDVAARRIELRDDLIDAPPGAETGGGDSSWPAAAAPSRSRPPRRGPGPGRRSRRGGPARRGRSGARLGALSSALPTPAPLPLVVDHGGATAPINGFRAPGVAELTEVAAATAAAAAATTGMTATTAEPSGRRRSQRRRRWAPGRVRARSSTPNLDAGGAGTPPPPRKKEKRSHRRAWIVGAVAAVVLLVAGGLAAAFEAKVFTPSHPGARDERAHPGRSPGVGVQGAHERPHVREQGAVHRDRGGGHRGAEPRRRDLGEGGDHGDRRALRRPAQRHHPFAHRHDVCHGHHDVGVLALPCHVRPAPLRQHDARGSARAVVDRRHRQSDDGSLRVHHHPRALAGSRR